LCVCFSLFSSVHSQLHIYRGQDKDKPAKIPCAQGKLYTLIYFKLRRFVVKPYDESITTLGTTNNNSLQADLQRFVLVLNCFCHMFT